MSALVEKTARAMCIANHGDPDEDMSNDGPRWKYWEPNARAAIAAVAEWLDPKEIPMVLADAPAEIIAAYLRGQLEQPKGAAGDGR
jgi:hypothetical protein